MRSTIRVLVVEITSYGTITQLPLDLAHQIVTFVKVTDVWVFLHDIFFPGATRVRSPFQEGCIECSWAAQAWEMPHG
jgi:hypothetical protein